MQSYGSVPSRSEPPRVAARAVFTDHLFYSWDRVPPAQRESILAMVQMTRAAVARSHRRRAIGMLLFVAALAVAALVYALVAFPA